MGNRVVAYVEHDDESAASQTIDHTEGLVNNQVHPMRRFQTQIVFQ